MDALELREAVRVMKLEETRLRSSALAFSLGIGSHQELAEAALNYGRAAQYCKTLEQEERMAGRAALYNEQSEVVP